MPDAGALEQIGRFTRRSFRPEELYVFPVALCDNEIDRDGERFAAAALEKLAALFVGRTGIFDHEPKAEGQAARIYACRVERDETRRTAAGEVYARLVAQAYLPRTPGNAEMIAALDAGIRKEVSVGCAVRKVTCSVCGADLRASPCEHIRGQTYGGTVCCAVLDDPCDAYEWSFVAVPAQREAGVLKRFRAEEEPPALTGGRARALLAENARLQKEAACGREYRAALQKEFLRCGALAHPGIPAESLARAAGALGTADLKAWGAAFRRRAERELPLVPQLAGDPKEKAADGNAPFRI